MELRPRSMLTLSQKSPCFWCVWSTSLLKALWEKKKLLLTSNFPFSHSIFSPFWKTLCHFHQIWNCCLQTLSVWNSLKFALLERVEESSIKTPTALSEDTISTFTTEPQRTNWKFLANLGLYSPTTLRNILSPLTDNNILDQTKLKAFADDKLNVTTRGPWWPWIAHLSQFPRKMNSTFSITIVPTYDPRDGASFDPWGIIWIESI